MFHNRRLNTLFILVVMLSMALASCQPAATPTAAPAAPTTAPAAAQPTEAPAAVQPTTAPAAAEPTAAPAAQENLNDTRPLVVQTPNDLDTFEPNEVSTMTDINIVQHVYDSLIKMDENQKLQPSLATEWKMLDDQKTWQFKLRQGVKFQNGEDFNAATVKYAFERGLDPQYKWTGNTPGYVFTSIGLTGVDIVDDYTVNIKLDRFEPDTPGYISEVYVYPMKYFQDNKLEDVAAKPSGSGPYQLKEWVKDDHITLERWDGYWGTKPALKTIVFRVIPEVSTAVAELLAGNVDIVSGVPPDQAETINASGTSKVVTKAGGRRIYIGFEQNCTSAGCKEVKDVRVRQALNMAVDVQGILDGLFGAGVATREGGMVNPPAKSDAIKPYDFDVAGAKKLLADAGYPDGFKCTMASPNGRYASDAQIAQAVAAQLKANVNVDCEVQTYEWSVYKGMISKKQLPAMFLLGTGSDFLSAWYDLSDLNSPEASTNYVNWANADWDKLVKELGTTTDPDARKKITDQLQMIVHTDAPWFFVYMQVDWYAVSDKVNWTPRADEKKDFTLTTYK
jgi:peptide/nickel transport system substrate-binding protein